MNRETPGLVARTRLTDLLARAGEVPLVLLSGPAGSGKTTLLDQWIDQGIDRWIGERAGGPDGPGRIVLEAEEGGEQLWPAFLRALEGLGLEPAVDPTPAVGSALLGPDRLRAVTATVAGSARELTLVLDGFELRDPGLAAEITYLLDHSWGRLHLVLAARVDPVLPLYRYRLEDRLVEVRAADLAFTDEEADELLRGNGAVLPPESVHELNARLGGWAAGLRFSARALAGGAGRSGAAVASVVAQDADIAEYLLGEVLSRQDEATRTLLLRTSVPDTLLPGLAEELAGPSASRGLQELAAANMFLEPVAGQPGSYRYPPFFRDLLRAQLAWEDPETAERLCRRSTAWLRSNRMPGRALEQLAAGGLWADLADQLVADHGVATLLLGTDRHVNEVAHRIPFRVSDAGACVVRAALALGESDAATCAAELDAARGALRSRRHHPADPVPAALSVLEALRACSVEDTIAAGAAVQQAGRAVAPLSGSPVGRDSEALVELARAAVALRCGELDEAQAALARVAAVPGLPTRLVMAVLGYKALADALQGRLTRASDEATFALELADEARLPVERRPAAPAVALALIALERDDRPAAQRQIAAARASGTLGNDPVSRTITAGVLGHLDAAAGRLRPTVDRLGLDEPHPGTEDPWLADWLRLQVAELWVADGHPDRALRELEAISHADHLGAAVVAAAAYAEQGRRSAVEESLVRARADERSLPAEVSRLLVQGVHESRQRAPQRALTLVERALRLAEEEEVRRPFREASPTVRRLLAGHPQLLSRHPWLGAQARPGALGAPGLTAGATPGATAGVRVAGAPATAGSGAGADIVVEPLTARESEVLGHLEELLTTEEIAARMFVSVNTVRTHVRSILRKLGVNRRNSAVRRARELGLLDRPERPAG